MSKYEIIKKIMESDKIDEGFKVHCIQSFLLNWETEKSLKWIWEDD